MKDKTQKLAIIALLMAFVAIGSGIVSVYSDMLIQNSVIESMNVTDSQLTGNFIKNLSWYNNSYNVTNNYTTSNVTANYSYYYNSTIYNNQSAMNNITDSYFNSSLNVKWNKTDNINSTLNLTLNISSNYTSLSRNINTLYWNNYTYPIYLEINSSMSVSTLTMVTLYKNNNSVAMCRYNSLAAFVFACPFNTIVPRQSNYSLNVVGPGVLTIHSWFENSMRIDYI